MILVTMFLAAGEARAQSPTPTPSPSPTPFSADKRGVLPEEVPGVPAIAPDYSYQPSALPDLGRVGVDTSQQKPMTVNEAIALALENNKDIEVTRKNVKIAEFDLRAARGFFQPRFNAQTSYDEVTIPNLSIFTNNQSTTQATTSGNVGLQGFVPRFGTVLGTNVNNQRVTTNNPISILSPQINSSIGFTLTQPLFRGRSFDQGRRTIEIAKRNLSLTDVQFRQRTIDIITNVQRAYWDLTYALRNLQVQRDGVRDAKEQLEHNRRMVEEGQLAPIDIIASETQVANFEQAVFDSLNTVAQAENALKNMISPNMKDGIWNESLIPVDSPVLEVPATSLPDAINLALQNRPELELNTVRQDINKIDQRYFREQKKPQIDFVGSYISSGIGGSQNPNFSPLFPSPCDTVPDSQACRQQLSNLGRLTGNPYAGIFSNRFPTYRAGINISLPLFGDKTASAQLGRSRVEGERLVTEREQLEQNILVEVRNAMQLVRTAEARLRSAAIARENSARQYESEQRRLDAGQSDVYRVLERQTALTAARSSELRAQIELNKAIADLHRATGNSLKANDVETKLPK